MKGSIPTLAWVFGCVTWACADSSAPAHREHSDSSSPRITESADAAAVGKTALDSGASPDDKPARPAAGGAAGASMPPVAAKPVEPFMLDQTGSDNPAGLSEADVKQLVAGGPPGSLRWLYPYDGTVFPADTLGPTLMWEGEAAADAIYLRIKASAFEYKTVIKPTLQRGSSVPLGVVSGMTPEHPQFQIPQDIWQMACEKTGGKADPFRVELSTRVRGTVAGPVLGQFTIAPGGVKGSLYYTSYYSKMLGLNTGHSAALLRIPSRGKAEVLLADVDGGCAGCHAIAANGARLTLLTLESSAPPTRGFSFELDPLTGATNPRAIHGGNAGLAALYPDGSKYLAQAQQKLAAHWELYTSTDFLFGPVTTEATLYDAITGEIVPDTNIPAGALMPMFSPDGTRLAFNDFAAGDAHGLAVMNYDTRAHKASAYATLVQEDPAGLMRPGWPSFLPDNKGVVFVRTDSPDFGGTTNDLSTALTTDPNMRQTVAQNLSSSDLHIVDVDTGQVTLLARAMGYDMPADFTRGVSYLPHGMLDLHRNYNPTVSPVAAGGYFWLFFDSLRNYGNLGLQRALWGTAIDIHPDGTYTSDPSHPPFYVAGQEFGADNHRAFSVRDLCRNDHTTCATGIDCCSGFCTAVAGAGRVCTPPMNHCAALDERCTTDVDCCDRSNYCINGFCAFVGPE